MKKKVFIIGSGFSSLSAACYLSKSGYDVHVFEKNNSLGGRAKEKYSQAIKLIPDYVDAYLNLVSVILEDEVSIVEQMNSLGNSKKDNIRYDELKVEREDLYKECVPLLEELLKVSPENIDALNTLKNIYGVLGNHEGFMELKAKIEGLQGN